LDKDRLVRRRGNGDGCGGFTIGVGVGVASEETPTIPNRNSTIQSGISSSARGVVKYDVYEKFLLLDER
jgi:hypothetical protein